MIELNLQQFAKTASYMRAYRKSIKMAKGQMPGKTESKPSSAKKESQDDVENRILDSRGNVKEIAYGQRYNFYVVQGESEKLYDYPRMTAADAKDFLEGYKYDEETGTFKDTNSSRAYRVKLAKKKKK